MTAVSIYEEKKKALIYTAIICGFLLLLFILIQWKSLPPSVPVIDNQIEINLGNEDEGFGDEQPLVKGSPSSEKQEPTSTPQATAANSNPNEQVNPDENAEATAAPIEHPEKNNKTKTDKSQPDKKTPTTTTPVKQVPKLTYPGVNKDKNGNSTEDNFINSQGKNLNHIADHGSRDGDKDSYGENKGGSIGGPKVINGNRRIKAIRPYKFNGDLKKGTVLAIVMVDASGKGKFVDFAKGSSKRDPAYVSAIKSYLNNMEFDTSDDESKVTVQFIFDVN